MRKLLCLALIPLAVGVRAQDLRQSLPGATMAAADPGTGPDLNQARPRSRLLWVSARGNDSTASAGKRRWPWKTVYDIYTTNPTVAYGAATVAQPGDWIVFEPGTYYVPAIPLNLPGDRGLMGVNLLVPPGATIIRTNFSNTNSAALPANLAVCGPLIVPGNSSRVIVEGTVTATNAEVYDGVFGWASLLSRYRPGQSQLYGFYNWPVTNVVLDGHGTLIGLSDVIYISSILGQGGGTLACRNIHLRSQWDCFYSAGTNSSQTRNVTAFSADNNLFRSSHGILVLTYGSWVDDHSSFTASGAMDTSPDNAAAYVSFYSTNRLVGTKLIANGSTNVAPFFSTNSVSSGWYWSCTSDRERHPVRVVLK